MASKKPVAKKAVAQKPVAKKAVAAKKPAAKKIVAKKPPAKSKKGIKVIDRLETIVLKKQPGPPPEPIKKLVDSVKAKFAAVKAKVSSKTK